MFSFLRTSGRSRALVLILLAFIALFTIRLFTIQVIEHGKYKAQALAEQQAKFVLKAQRGQIFATDGLDAPAPLVLNEPVYTVYADPSQVKNADGIKSTITSVAGDKAVGDLSGLTDKTRQYMVLAKQLTRQQAETIKAKGFSGVGETQTTVRVYPEGSLASQLLGFVNADGQGQYGIEQALNDRLKGTDGVLQTVTDVRNIPLTVSDNDISIPARDGANVVLTIDRTIQSYAEQALSTGLKNAKATVGGVIVMDPQTGKIMAMANYPTYDPSNYGTVNDASVFQNGIVSNAFEVGSVMKTLTMGAGLDSGAVNYNSTFNDSTGCNTVDDAKICNVETDPRSAHATMTDTLEYSLNTGVNYVLSQMGGGTINRTADQKLYDYFHNRYRFGQVTGIEQTGEEAGIIVSPAASLGPNVKYANMTFGQGLTVTMLQMAAAFGSAINGGTYYQPTLLDGQMGVNGQEINKTAPKIVEKNVLSAQSSQQLNEMIYQARKLGFFGNVDPAGFRVGGKTGTAQVIDPKTGAYTNDNSIGTYLGFGGNSTAKYVIMTYVKDSHIPGYAGTTAAGPIFNNISNWLLQYLRVSPNQ
jgi:cell division protein FtsI/penicillin-binding protein 2